MKNAAHIALSGSNQYGKQRYVRGTSQRVLGSCNHCYRNKMVRLIFTVRGKLGSCTLKKIDE